VELMEVENLEINWNNRWGNDVGIVLKVKNLERPKFKYESKRRGRHTLFFAYDRKTGLVNYYAYDPRDKTGFSGAVYELPLKNGKTRKIVGPWSSRSEVMNEYFKSHNTEITIKEDEDSCLIGGYAMSNSRIIKYLKQFRPDVKYYISEEKRVFIPKDQPANERFI